MRLLLPSPVPLLSPPKFHTPEMVQPLGALPVGSNNDAAGEWHVGHQDGVEKGCWLPAQDHAVDGLQDGGEDGC